MAMRDSGIRSSGAIDRFSLSQDPRRPRPQSHPRRTLVSRLHGSPGKIRCLDRRGPSGGSRLRDLPLGSLARSDRPLALQPLTASTPATFQGWPWPRSRWSPLAGSRGAQLQSRQGGCVDGRGRRRPSSSAGFCSPVCSSRTPGHSPLIPAGGGTIGGTTGHADAPGGRSAPSLVAPRGDLRRHDAETLRQR